MWHTLAGFHCIRRQAITWANVHLVSIGNLGTHFSEIVIGIQMFLSKLYFNGTFKMSPILLRLQFEHTNQPTVESVSGQINLMTRFMAFWQFWKYQNIILCTLSWRECSETSENKSLRLSMWGKHTMSVYLNDDWYICRHYNHNSRSHKWSCYGE